MKDAKHGRRSDDRERLLRIIASLPKVHSRMSLYGTGTTSITQKKREAFEGGAFQMLALIRDHLGLDVNLQELEERMNG